MAVDMFLKVPDIPGASVADKHKGEIEILSYAFGVSQAGGSAAGGGAGAGKATLSDLHVVARTSKASPGLFLHCASGKHIPEAVLSCRKAGAKQADFLTVRMKAVLITSYNQSGAAEDDAPVDQVTLAFERIEFEYRAQDAKGALGPPVKGGWDLKANKKI